MRRLPPAPRQGQSGASLMIALALLLLLGIVIPAVVGLAYAGAKATQVSVEDRSGLYAATSAVESAIQYGRLTQWVGRFGAPCPDITVDVDGADPTVSCVGSTGPFDLDRTVTYSGTAGGRAVVTATVRYGDGSAGSGAPSVTVLSWSSSPDDLG